jgi:hypothetical protein
MGELSKIVEISTVSSPSPEYKVKRLKFVPSRSIDYLEKHPAC